MEFSEVVHTGPGTLAGRYLRMFWQPVCCAYELASGRTLPVRILGEDFTVYRGDSGIPHLVGPRCAHRGTQLSVGSVEGECIRCFYHGWKYDGSGQCVEQPAEGQSFAEKVRIPSYRVQEYIGLVFAYLGEGEPPPLPRYPRFESADISLDVAGLKRICNYFNNIDNSLDSVHVRFVHQRHRDSVDDHVVLGDPVISVEESDWGVKRYVQISRRQGRDVFLRHAEHQLHQRPSGRSGDQAGQRDCIQGSRGRRKPYSLRSPRYSAYRRTRPCVDRRAPGAAYTGRKRSAGARPGDYFRKTSAQRRGSKPRRFRHVGRRSRPDRPGSDRRAW